MLMPKRSSSQAGPASESKVASQNYCCPVRQVRLARQLFLARLRFDPNCSFALLCSFAPFDNFCRPTASKGNFSPLVSFAPRAPYRTLSSFLQLLVIFFERNTVSAVLLICTFLHHLACTVSFFLLAPHSC